MERIDFKIYSIINKRCEMGEFIIIGYDDILSELPVKSSINKATVKDSLDALKKEGYISIKYEDFDRICVCILPKEVKIIDNVTYIPNQPEKKKSTFFPSFFGGVLGGILVLVAYLFLKGIF